MTVIFENDRDNIKTNQTAKYRG